MGKKQKRREENKKKSIKKNKRKRDLRFVPLLRIFRLLLAHGDEIVQQA